MQHTRLLASIALAAMLAACGRSEPVATYNPQAPQVQQAQAPAPVVVNQAPAASGNDGLVSGALLGGVAGYLMGRNSAPAAPSYSPPQVIERRTIVNNYQAPRPVPVPAAAPAPRVVSTPAPVPVPAPAAKPAAAPAKPSYASTYYAPSRPAPTVTYRSAPATGRK